MMLAAVQPQHPQQTQQPLEARVVAPAAAVPAAVQAAAAGAAPEAHFHVTLRGESSKDVTSWPNVHCPA